jgi:hypothetical protein
MSKPDTDQETLQPKKKASWNRFTIFIVFLLDLILPAPLAGGLVLLVFGYFRNWGLNQTLVLILYCVAVVVAAVLLSLVLNLLVPPFRTMFLRTRNATFRRGVVLLAGVIVPAIFLVAANTLLLPGGRTSITTLMPVVQRPVVTTPADDVGNTALQSTNPSTKILGIRVLQGFHSTEALNLLMRMAREDTLAMQDAPTRDALAAAIASYGAEARPGLLSLFKSIDPAQPDPAAGGADFYDRYFSQSFDSLKNEIDGSALEAAAKETRLQQLTAAQQELQAALTGLQGDPAPVATNARMDFVVQAFLGMDLKADVEALNFAKSTVANEKMTSRVRGDACLLIAKLGNAKDLELLYPLVRSQDEYIQARALQAIALLQQKAGPVTSEATSVPAGGE